MEETRPCGSVGFGFGSELICIIIILLIIFCLCPHFFGGYGGCNK